MRQSENEAQSNILLPSSIFVLNKASIRLLAGLRHAPSPASMPGNSGVASVTKGGIRPAFSKVSVSFFSHVHPYALRC